MAKASKTVEEALETLQRTIRRSKKDAEPVESGEVPPHLVERFASRSSGEEGLTLVLSADEKKALIDGRRLLRSDLRFEHLSDRDIQNYTWEFACRAHLDPDAELVQDFFEEHGREPADRTCYLPLELLEVTEPVEFQGVTILPREDVEPPAIALGPDPRPLGGSVVAVQVRGTDYGKMRDRALEKAERAVRLLRVSLRADRWVPDAQLLFRVGVHAWFDDGASTWQRDSGAGSVLTLDKGLRQHLDTEPIASLPERAESDLYQRVERALRWFDRAQRETDPVIALLFLFSALEGLLGEKSEGLKAGKLAMRRAMLGSLASGGFTDPDRTLRLYDEVRSYAVHGEETPVVGENLVARFSDDVRRALNEVLSFAELEGITTRKALRRALDGHERRDKVKAGLRERNPELWEKFFAKEDEQDTS